MYGPTDFIGYMKNKEPNQSTEREKTEFFRYHDDRRVTVMIAVRVTTLRESKQKSIIDGKSVGVPRERHAT